MMDGIGIELCSSVLGMSDRAAQCIRCRLNDTSSFDVGDVRSEFV